MAMDLHSDKIRVRNNDWLWEMNYFLPFGDLRFLEEESTSSVRCALNKRKRREKEVQSFRHGSLSIMLQKCCPDFITVTLANAIKLYSSSLTSFISCASVAGVVIKLTQERNQRQNFSLAVRRRCCWACKHKSQWWVARFCLWFNNEMKNSRCDEWRATRTILSLFCRQVI